MQAKEIAVVALLLLLGCTPVSGTAKQSAAVVGPEGVTGPAGVSGSMGPVGPTGPRGLSGADGLPGLPGADGLAGAVGATGATGMRGAPGTGGPQGDMGPAGPQGTAGAAGAVGPAGPMGPGWNKSNLYGVSSVGNIAPTPQGNGTSLVAACHSTKDLIISGGCQFGLQAGTFIAESAPSYATDPNNLAQWSCTFVNGTNVTVYSAAAYALCLSIP